MYNNDMSKYVNYSYYLRKHYQQYKYSRVNINFKFFLEMHKRYFIKG